MEQDKALRPNMPTDPEAQLRWLMARQTEALVQVAVAAQQLTEAVVDLRQVVSVLLARAPRPAE